MHYKIERNAGRRFHTVLLDAAGTLIEPASPVADTYARIARELGAELGIDTLSRAFVEVFASMPKLAFSCDSASELHRMEYQWWRDLVLRVVQRCGVTMDEFDEYFGQLYWYYAQGDAWVCYPEVNSVLSQLRASRYHLAVVSNFDSRLPGVLRELGIAQYMDDVVYSSEAGSAKPDKGIFHLALERLGVAAQGAIHVGDSVEADLNGARSAGIDSLLVDRRSSRVQERKDCIADLNGLLKRFGLK